MDNIEINPDNILADFDMVGYHDMGANYLESDFNMASNQDCNTKRDDIIISGDICKQIGARLGSTEKVRILIIRE